MNASQTDTPAPSKSIFRRPFALMALLSLVYVVVKAMGWLLGRAIEIVWRTRLRRETDAAREPT